MSFILRCSDQHLDEREYIARYLLETRLGLIVKFQYDSGQMMVLEGPGDRRIKIPDRLFSVPPTEWLTEACYPETSVLRWDHPNKKNSLISNNVVALYPLAGGGRNAFDRTDEVIEFQFDLLGAAFFLLSGMEEILRPNRDLHGRFPSSSALLVLNGAELRPIVDEYVELLKSAIECLWPGSTSICCKYTVGLSHDIDEPFLYHGLSPLSTLGRFLRKLAGTAVVRRSLQDSSQTIAKFVSYLVSGVAADPYFTLRELMNISEMLSVTSCFYFIVDANSKMDGRSYFQDPIISDMFREISARGHSIGLHASYACYNAPNRAKHETEILRRWMNEAGVSQSELGVRHHYLRWAGPQHWRIWDDAGMDYDATVGYSDRLGFRSGTSHPFPTFDLLNRKALNLIERPLTLMDVAICPPNRAGWASKRMSILSSVRVLAQACRSHGGRFELLWHNTQLQTDFEREAYAELLGILFTGAEV